MRAYACMLIWDIGDKMESSLLFLSVSNIYTHQYAYTDAYGYGSNREKKKQ